MSFGENVGYCRKKLKITQEELAEKLFVSRQTVSRWETDSAFPDVDMLVKLCDLFECDMDTLVRGDVSKKETEGNCTDNIVKDDAVHTVKKHPPCDLDKYDKHMNSFSLLISLGVGLIIFGVSLLLLIMAFAESNLWSVVALMTCIAIAVFIFIYAGITHHNFMSENPYMEPYPEEKKKEFMKKTPVAFALATALILVGVIAIIVMNVGIGPSLGLNEDGWGSFSTSVLMLCICIAVAMYVYFGIQISKYEVDEYNNECIKEGFIEGTVVKKEAKRGERIKETICSIIMMIATASFLLLGFISNLWHPAWVAFPIGGILCGIVSVIIEGVSKEK